MCIRDRHSEARKGRLAAVMNRHSMVTRLKSKETSNQEEMEAEVIVNNQPEKPIQDSEREQQSGDHEPAKGGPSLQDIMNFIAETSKKTDENFKKQEQKIYNKMDQNKEELNKKLESLQEGRKEDREFLKKSIELLNNKLESNQEALKRSQEALEKKSEELNLSLIHI